MMLISRVILVGLLVLTGTAGWARDVALVIGNDRYARQDNFGIAANVKVLSQVLRNDGFEVIDERNLRTADLVRVAVQLSRQVEDAERVIVVLAGRFAHNSADTFLLGTDARIANRFGLGRNGISLSAVMQTVAAAAPNAVVMLVPAAKGTELSGGAEAGVGPLDVPQGVFVAQGAPTFLRTLLADGLLVPGTSYAKAIGEASESLKFSGLASSRIGLTNGETGARSQGGSEEVGEFAYWSAVRDIGTLEALQAYLKRYPRGRFADEARAEIAAVRDRPLKIAQDREAALNLQRDERRRIQRDLSLLGFNTRGIDGIFGRGTRAALSDWQKDQGLEVTGFIDRDQIERLDSQAALRARQLELEAEQKRLEEERRDIAYWRQTGRSGREADLREYLERYPDGLYAERAQELLAAIEAERRAQARAEERAFWDDVTAAGTAGAYRQYLERYPNGSFVSEAQAQLSALTRQDDQAEQVEADKAEEQRVAGNQITRLLAEQRLAQLKLEPGKVDGQFNKATRRAIRRFQRARNITPTGYLSQRTLVLLLAAR